MSKFKYMGSADVRILEAGETFGGRLATPLAQDIVFDWTNHHVVDSSDYPNVPKEVWDLLGQEPGFEDVSSAKVFPLGLADKLWRAKKEGDDPTVHTPQQSADVVTAPPSALSSTDEDELDSPEPLTSRRSAKH